MTRADDRFVSKAKRKAIARRLARTGIGRARARAAAWHPRSPEGKAAIKLALDIEVEQLANDDEPGDEEGANA